MRHVHDLREQLILYLSAFATAAIAEQSHQNIEPPGRDNFYPPPPREATSTSLSKANAQPDSGVAIVGLKEDLLRKSKLLAALKTARNADLNSLEQWKSEYKKMEETNKRLFYKCNGLFKLDDWPLL
jgi:hypothetical protein